MDKYTGKKLDGRYEIRELIGVGGMANVYHCYDTIDAREVAIKILKDEFLDNEDFIRRFKNESKAIAVLNHPNIVRVYDVSFGDMIQYIVMEYIDGITLKEYIDMQGVLDWKETVHLTTQILKALQHAHENGIIHRDIKPHNIMLLQDGTIKVTDFGIARFSSNATRTMTEQAIGSVHYIAPEQARGEKTDGKTDIYSVGVMMYEMLTGQLPFDADSAVSVALMQLQAKARRPREVNPSIPEGLEEITLKAMQKNPEDRYHSALEMLSDIERFRLNPSIRFEYQYFEDKPKYNDAVRKHKTANTPPAEKDVTAQDYEDDPPYRSPIPAAITGMIIAAVLALLIFGGLALLKGYNSNQPKELMIPDFVGMKLKDAVKENNGQFLFDYETRYSDEYEQDEIIEQDPAAGSKKVRPGAKITLIINSADSEKKVPAARPFDTTEDIVNRLEDSNLIPKVFYVESEKASGKVDSLYPEAGTTVKIGSTVYVFISNGNPRPNLTLPDLTNCSLEEAKNRLKEAGFDENAVQVSYDEYSTAEKDTVVRQNPLQGSHLNKNHPISLVLAPGVKPEKTFVIEIDLPVSVSEAVQMDVEVNGVPDRDNSLPVIPSLRSYYTISFTANDSSYVTVTLNGSPYREYTVDYETGAIQTLSYAYPPGSEDTPTEPAGDTPTEDSSSTEENTNG